MKNPFAQKHSQFRYKNTQIYINVCMSATLSVSLFTLISFLLYCSLFCYRFHIVCKKRFFNFFCLFVLLLIKKTQKSVLPLEELKFHATSTTPNLAKLANVVGSPGWIFSASR